MNTIQIDHALQSWLGSQSKYPQSIYKGTFALNQVPHVEAPFAMVLNTDPLMKEGDHWIAVYCASAHDPVEFFDTRGFPLNEYYTKHVLSVLAPRVSIVYNLYPIQSVCSTVCGEFCIAYLYHRICGISFDEFLSFFSAIDLRHNDHWVFNFVHKNFDVLKFKRVLPAFLC
jgi:hypothetical protein